MIRVTIDAELRSKLNGLTEPVDLCDERGYIVAHVVPVLDPAQYEPVEPEISEEELRRIEAEEGEYTTAEVLAYLESL